MVAARAAILQVLRRGPSYGRQLTRRVSQATGGKLSLAPGSLYPALRDLRMAGLIRAWTVVAGRTRGGRARTYYELTLAGIREAESEAAALAGLLSGGRSPRPLSSGELASIRDRIERVATLFDFARRGRQSLARPRRRA